MKRYQTRICAVLLLIAQICTAVLFLSCKTETKQIRSDVPAMTVLETALHALSVTPHASIYDSRAADTEDSYLEPEYAGQLFWDEYGKPLAEDGAIEEYALCIPEGLYAIEIDVFKCAASASANGAEAIDALLASRMKLKTDKKSQMLHYLGTEEGAEYEVTALDEMELFVLGSYRLLLATPDNASVKAAVSGLLGAGGADAGKRSDSDSAGNGNVPLTTEALTSAVITEAETEAETESAAVSHGDGFTMTITSHSAPDRVVLGGTCAAGARIVVTGAPKDHTFGTDDGFWLCEVEIFSEGDTTLSVSQMVDDRIYDPYTVTVAYDPDVDFSNHSVFAVLVGDNMQGHFVQQIDDWTGTNVMSSAAKTKVGRAVAEKVSYLNENADGAKLVYLIVPDQVFIYPETVPERYVRSDKPETRKEQFVSAARDAGAIVVDLYDVMTAHRDDPFKIYHKTDSHWTDYGAYLGYSALMETIAADFPDVAPLPIDGNFRFYKQVVTAGDMMTHLEIPNKLLSENCTFVEWLVDLPNHPELYMDGKNELDFTPVRDGQKIVNPNAEGKTLPRAMIIRDSFSTNLFGYVNQSFAEVDWMPMWDYRFSKVEIKRFMPDYVIYIVGEKTLGSILY